MFLSFVKNLLRRPSCTPVHNVHRSPLSPLCPLSRLLALSRHRSEELQDGAPSAGCVYSGLHGHSAGSMTLEVPVLYFDASGTVRHRREAHLNLAGLGQV